MKVKVIRSGEKGFEEEKAEMFKDVQAKKGLTKKEQLRIAFIQILEINSREHTAIDGERVLIGSIENITNGLLKEVTIRVNLGG